MNEAVWIFEALVTYAFLIYGIATNQPLWCIVGCLWTIACHLAKIKDKE